MADLRKLSATSNIIRLILSKNDTGEPLTGLTSASAGLIISTIADVENGATAYTQAGATIESITTLGTYVAPTATKCRFKEVDATNHPGLYEIQIADARFAVANAKTLIITVSGVSNLKTQNYLVEFDVATNVAKISDDATAADNLESAYDGTGYFNSYAPAQQQQVQNIAVTSAALNATAGSRTITSGSGSGGVANTSQEDGTTDDIADAAGAIDFYYEFDLSATAGAVGVGIEWTGQLVGVTNTIKVYARNWGGAAWEQIGTILGSTGMQTAAWELTSAHTSAGLVRLRFANTGLTAATLKTDRVLLGYAVVPSFPANFSSLVIDGSGNVNANVKKINDNSAAAAAWCKAARAVWSGTVTGSATTGGFADSTATQADTDFWKGRVVVFLTGALAYQASPILAFTPASDLFTLATLTAAPSNGDEYIIV